MILANKIQLIYFTYNLARTLPHALLSLYLLNKGFSLNDITLIQIWFSIGIIIFELPAGMLADYSYRKYVFILGVFLILIAYLFVPITLNINVLSLLWFIYGAGMSCISGTLDNDLFYLFKIYDQNEQVPIYRALITKVMFMGGLVGGGFGALIYKYNGDLVYYFASIIFLIVIIYTAIQYPRLEKHLEKPQSIKVFFNGFITNRSMYRLYLSVLSLTIFTTMYYVYWQVLFSELGFASEYFGIYYIVSQLLAIFAANIYVKFLRFEKKLYIATAVLFILTLISSFFFQGIYFLVIFFFFILIYYILQNYCYGAYAKALSHQNISSNTSFISMLQNITGLIILLLIRIVIEDVSITHLFIGVSLIFIIINGYSILKHPKHIIK